MRYHYKKKTKDTALYGEIHICDHPVYSTCTLYKIGNRGLAVIQQKYNTKTKSTMWTAIDVCLMDELYLHPGFGTFFNERAGESVDGVYPTVTIRQMMWALKIKPLKRERWETCFDRRYI